MTNAGRQPRAQSRGNDLRAGGEGRAGGPAAGYGRSTQPRGAAFHARMKKYADGGGVTDPLAGMSPVDLARLRAELAAKPREMTVDERWRNYATTGADVAGSLPVIGNVMSAYDAYQGGKGAVDAAQAGDVRGAALNTAAAGLGALGAVSGIPWSRTAGEVARDARSTARIFAGPKAKTANTVALAKAQSMQGAGADPADIWRETGWFQGKDGGWRFEIDDSGASMSGTLGENLGKSYDHPALYDAYPQLRDVETTQGSGYGKASYIGGDAESGIPPEIRFSRGATPSITAHEVQHAIQDIEGTARGGSPTYAYFNKNEGAWPIYRERLRKMTETVPIEDYARAAGFDDIESARESYADYVKGQRKLKRNIPAYLDRIAQESAAQEWYKRLAGEVEARNVQNRLNMRSDERRATVPWSTQDVPTDQQIVRKVSDGPQDAFPVYHGTPHTVDRFRMDRIGTGEGAQVYGHGLYFAENPEVARWYRDQLGNLEFEVPPSALEPSTAHSLARTAASQKLRGDELNRVFMRNWQASLDRALATGDEALAAKSREALKIGDHVSRQNVRRQGNVYRVDIDAEPEHFLDLDLPLVRQSPRVQEAVRKLGIDPVEYRDGHWLQKEIWRHADDDTPAGASRMMREVGIPGNRYLDQGSRSQAGGSRNYVIWDDSIIGPPTKEPYANGGTAARVGEYMRGGRVTVGAVEGATGGRTDALAVDVPEGAYVIPADVVAALGEGNTTAGMRQLEQQFGRPRHASGGRVVPIMVSDGEFVVSPEHVEAVGGADVLDRFVMQRRRAYVDQLARMPGPKQ